MGVSKGVHELPEIGKKHHFKGDMFLEAALFEGLKFGCIDSIPEREVSCQASCRMQKDMSTNYDKYCLVEEILHYLGICLNLQLRMF